MQNKLEWKFYNGNMWEAFSSVNQSQIQDRQAWQITTTESGLFKVNCSRGLLLDKSFSPSFSNLTAAKEWCQSQEDNLVAAASQEETLATKKQWLDWLKNFGADKFLDFFLANTEGAQAVCKHCGGNIYLDLLIGGGCPDWSTADGDFGCAESPDTNSEGTGGHEPYRRKFKKGKWVRESKA